MNKTTSSAYSDTRCPMSLAANGCNSPSSSALVNNAFSTSITRMKRSGDKGSPWRNPLRCSMTSPGYPFNNTRVDEVDNRLQSIRRQQLPNPKC
uniref:Uncharacterized protein n=1 Tax=Arundo donax TaxID=35708 RepID=A0A0A9HG41_ARUDO